MKLVHLAGLALFFGGTAAVILVVHGGEGLEAGAHRAFAFQLAWQLQLAVLLPGALALAVSGVVLSLTGPWGFVRHWWMLAKLVGIGILTMHSQFEYRPLTGLMLEAARAGSLPGDWAHQLFHFQRVGVIQLTVLVLLSAVSLFKPGGRTRWGRAKAAGV